MSRIVLFAAWIAAVVVIQWRQVVSRLHEAAFAFQGPFILHAGLPGHWAAVLMGASLTGVFWLAAFGCGSLVLALAGRPRGLDVREAWPATLLLGFGIYGCMTVAFGLLGLFFAPRAWTVLFLLAMTGLRFVRRARSVPSSSAAPPAARWFARAAVVCVLLVSVLSVTPETWIDSLSYHLTAPQDFIQLHKWVDIPQDTYRYPLLPEGIFAQGLLLGGEKAALLLNLSGTCLVLWLLWAWTDRLAGRCAAWLAVAALVSSNQAAFHMAQANQGMFSVGFAFLGVWAWMFTARGSASSRWAFLAGAGFGWALCSKYTAAAPVAGIVAWHLVRAIRKPLQEVAILACLFAGMALASMPFLVNGWLFTRNPVYPLFFGGLDWTPENTAMLRLFGCVGYDFALSDANSIARSVFRVLTGEQPLFLLALPAILSMRGRHWVPFSFAWVGATVAWSIGVPCLRFMMPAFPAMALVSAVALTGWFAAGGMKRALALAATAVMIVLGMIESIGAADMGKRSYAAALGLEPEGHYLRRVLTTYDEAARAVNAICRPTDRVLVIGDARGYRIEPLALNRDVEDTPVMLEMAREARSPAEIGRRLRQMGVDFVLLNYVTSGYLAFYWNQVFRWRPEEIRRAWEYWRTHGEVAWRGDRPDGINGGYVLYRIGRRPSVPLAMMPFLPGAEMAGIRPEGADAAAWARRLEVVAQFAPGVAFFDARLATALLGSGRSREALAVATRALDCDYPEKHVLLGIQAHARLALGQPGEALVAAKKAEALFPGETSLVRLRVECERLISRGR